MPLPAAVTTVSLHGKIVHPDDGAPAVGQIGFRMPYALRDTADNVIVGPQTITVDLDDEGEFTVALIATDDADLTPQGWTYTVVVATDAWNDSFDIEVPVATVGTLELADITPSVVPPTVVTYATVSQLAAHQADTTNVHGIADTSALETVTGSAAKVAAHTAASDPHGDRAFTTAAIATHEADTTNVHGIANTALLETISGAAAQIATHSAASDPHGDRAYAAGLVTTHEADTTAVHGIANTANLVLTSDSRLSDARTPTAHASSHASAGSDPLTLAQSQITGLSAALAALQPLDSDLTAFAGLTPSNDDIPQRKAGSWTNRTPSQFKIDLALVKGDVGLGNVDNTSDASKPISTATQTALDGKAASSHNHAAADITSGTLGVSRGGTGVGSVTAGSYLKGAGTSALVERTPAEVLSDIGAAASGHTHTIRKTIVLGDDRPVIGTGSGSMRWYNREGTTLTIVGVWAAAGVVPTDANIIVDVHKNGVTIFTTQANRPTVPDGTNGGAISATPDVTSLAAGDYLTVDIDQVGSTIAGGQLSVGVVVTYAG